MGKKKGRKPADGLGGKEVKKAADIDPSEDIEAYLLAEEKEFHEEQQIKKDKEKRKKEQEKIEAEVNSALYYIEGKKPVDENLKGKKKAEASTVSPLEDERLLEGLDNSEKDEAGGIGSGGEKDEAGGIGSGGEKDEAGGIGSGGEKDEAGGIGSGGEKDEAGGIGSGGEKDEAGGIGSGGEKDEAGGIGSGGEKDEAGGIGSGGEKDEAGGIGSGLSTKFDKLSLDNQTLEGFQPPFHSVQCLIEAKINNSGDHLLNGFITMGKMSLDASFIRCSDHQFEHFEELRNLGLACPHILTSSQVIRSHDQNYLVVEPLETVQDFFHRKYQNFLDEYNFNDAHFPYIGEDQQIAAMEVWWKKIMGDFYTIFRDVVKGLIFLYGKKQLYPCGNLGSNIFVSRKSGSCEDVIEIQAKLLPSMVATDDYIEDANQLLETMKSIIFPTAWNFDEERHANCPYFEVRHYLRFISLNEHLGHTFFPWIVDHPFLWNSFERVLFIKELGKLRKKTYKNVIDGLGSYLSRYFDDQNDWKSHVKDPLLKAILEKPKSGLVAPYEKEKDIVRFFISCYAHANDHEFRIHRTEYLEDDEIEEKLSCTFPKIYVWIKDGLLDQAADDSEQVKVLDNLLGIKHLL